MLYKIFFSVFFIVASWYLKLKFKQRLVNDPQFFQDIQEDNYCINIMTADEHFSRYMALQQRELSFGHGNSEQAQLSLKFSSLAVAWRFIQAVKKDKAQAFSFIQNKELIMEGDFAIFQKLLKLKP